MRMAMKAKDLGQVGHIVANSTLVGVLIYELIGPLLTKISLTKAGEIDPEGKTSARTKPNLEWLLHHGNNKHHQ